MSTDYVEICQEVVKQAGTQNMNSEILTKFLSQLISFSSSVGENKTVNVRSVLARILRGNSALISKLEKVLKKTVKVKKLKKASVAKAILRRNLTSTTDRSTSPLVNVNGTNTEIVKYPIVKLEQTKLPLDKAVKKDFPKIYLKNVLSTQGIISKSNFMEYFELQQIGAVPKVEPALNSSNGMIKLSQAANIPVSSDLGKKLALRENHVLLEEFKLRKITRAEWYINKPVKKGHLDKNKTKKNPSSNSRTNKLPSSHTDSRKSRKRGQVKKDALLKICKPLSVIIERIDLLEKQKRLAFNAWRRKKYHMLKNKKLSKNAKVKLSLEYKTVVDNLLKKQRRKCNN